jgi:PhnB protein
MCKPPSHLSPSQLELEINMRVEPYLMFSGRCAEALSFYQTAVGAQPVMVMRFKESPEPPHMPLPPNWGEKIMHCGFMVGQTLVNHGGRRSAGQAPV